MSENNLINKMISKSSYPQPLSESEETQILINISNGDEDAKKILIEHNLRLVAHIAKKYAHLEHIDDLISIGNFGLIKAVNSYIYGKGFKFSTYASRCIENEMLMHLRKVKKITEKEISLSKDFGNKEEGDTKLTVLDKLFVVDENTVFENVDKSLQVEKLKIILEQVLKPMEYKVIAYRYGFLDGIAHTQKEIGASLNISRSYASRLEQNAITKLKDYFSNLEDWNY